MQICMTYTSLMSAYMHRKAVAIELVEIICLIHHRAL